MSSSSGVTGREVVPDIQKLNLDEIEYELVIRGVNTEEEDQPLTRLEEAYVQPVIAQKVRELNLQDELVALTGKAAEIRTLLGELGRNGRVDGSERVVTLHHHCVCRLIRIMFLEPQYYEEFKKVGKMFNTQQRKLDQMSDELIFPRIYDTEDEEQETKKERLKRQYKEEAERKRREEEVKRQREMEEQYRKQHEEHNKKKTGKKSESKDSKKTYRTKVEYNSDTSSDSSAEEKKKRSRRRSTNVVAKWSFRYGGGEGVQAFLENIEEAARINNVEDDELLRGVSALLEEPAKSWFKVNRDLFYSWDALKNEITTVFDPNDSDEELLEKIDNLKQEESETFAVYAARMECLFKRLKHPLREEDKLRKLLKGTHVYYRSRFRSKEATSIFTLKKICKELETDKKAILSASKKDKRKEVKEEKKEKKKSTPVYAAQATTESSAEEEATGVSALNLNAVCCWRCGDYGHFSSTCTKQVFCIGCGRKDVIVENCKTCKQARIDGKWDARPMYVALRPPMENSSGVGSGGVPYPLQVPITFPPPNFQKPQPEKGKKVKKN